MSKNVIDNTIQEEGLCSFFKNLGRISAEAGKKLATNVIKNPDRALKKTSNTATTTATKNLKAAVSSLPEVIKYNHTGGGLYLGNFFKFHIIQMDQETDIIYPSAPLKNSDLEQGLAEKNDVNSLNNSINNIKGMITYFKDENNKSKKKNKINRMITTTFKSFDTLVILETTSSSNTLSSTGIGLIAITISTGAACRLSFGNKVIYEIIINRYNRYKKQDEKDQQTIEPFNKKYGKSYQDNVIDKNEYES